MGKREWKIFTAGMTFLGSIFILIGRIFGQSAISWDNGSQLAESTGSVGWYLLLVAPLIYIILDWPFSKPKEKRNNPHK